MMNRRVRAAYAQFVMHYSTILSNTYCCPNSKALKRNWRDGESNPKIQQHFTAFFQRFDHGAALKIERKMSHLNITFDRYASIGSVMHYIMVISTVRANEMLLRRVYKGLAHRLIVEA